MMPFVSKTGGDGIIPKSPLPIRHQASVLFDQQVWCWGCDVLHPDGNHLTKVGFRRLSPPPELKECSSVYDLEVNGTQRITLRGFGTFWGDDRKGGLWLLRDRFRTMFLESSRCPEPCWSAQRFMQTSCVNGDYRSKSLRLLLELLDWIRRYELQVLAEYGLNYRRRVLEQWDNGNRHVLPAETVPVAWRRCAQLIADQPDAFLCPTSGSISGKLPSDQA